VASFGRLRTGLEAVPYQIAKKQMRVLRLPFVALRVAQDDKSKNSVSVCLAWEFSAASPRRLVFKECMDGVCGTAEAVPFQSAKKQMQVLRLRNAALRMTCLVG
jgi:hypothetical protein